MKIKRKLLFVCGTRPEVIKLAPLILASKCDENLLVEVCATGQHKEMLAQMFDFFGVEPDYNLDVMTHNQSLSSVISKILVELDAILKQAVPDIVIVQGDTASAYGASLTAHHHRIPTAHVEAGLRSGDKLSPFPEEVYRKMISHLAEYHFAPTESARANLEKEGIVNNVWVTGNTVVDALLAAKEKIYSSQKHVEYKNRFNFAERGRKMILVTGHRRESLGKPFQDICEALLEIVNANKDVEIIYPVHLNPNVRTLVHNVLGGEERIYLINPSDYPEFVWLMDSSHFIITDSGGVQEEAPSLGKPVLVTRGVTERMEGVSAGCSVVVGSDKRKICEVSNTLLRDSVQYQKMSQTANPYGDGVASKKILEIIQNVSL